MNTNSVGERIELRGYRYIERTGPSGYRYWVRSETSEVIYLNRADLSGSSRFCMRDRVAGIRRRDWKKCCPFELSGNPEVDKVYASIVLEADNAMVNRIPEDTQAPNVLAATQVGNAEVHEARSENPNTDEMVGDAAANNTITGETSAAAAIRANAIAADSTVEIINISDSDSDNAVAAETDQQQETAIADDDAADTCGGGPLDERNSSEDSLATRNMNRRRRNLSLRKPQKYRKLADIYKQLGSCIYASEDKVESESTDETSEDDSDEITLGNFIRGKRSVRANSKRIDALKNKRKTRQDAEARLDKGKRAKSVSEDNRGNDLELGSKYYLRRNKIREFSPEDSSLSRGNKSNRETVQEDCARKVLKLLDGNERRFTEEENHSAGPSRGVKRARRLVQTPTTAISIRDVETGSSGRVHKRIRESSPPSDSETMAVLQLLRLSNAWVDSKSPSKPTPEDAPLSAADRESPLALEAPLSAVEPESPLGLDAPVSAAEPESPLGLDAPVSAADPEIPLGFDAPVSAADPESPLGLDAPLSATDPGIPLGLGAPLSAADPEIPLGFDAPVSAADPESPLGLDAPLSAADPGIPLGLGAPLSTADPESPLRLDAPLSAADSESSLGVDGVAPPVSEPMVPKPNVEVNVIDGGGLPRAEKTKSETFVCRVSRNPAEFSIPNAKKFMRRGKAMKAV